MKTHLSETAVDLGTGVVRVAPLPTVTTPRAVEDVVSPLTVSPDTTGLSLPCWTKDPEIWFAETPEGVEYAKALCGTCPLQDVCLADALARQEPWGVWGGQLIANGEVVARKRPRGRPRKDAVAA